MHTQNPSPPAHADVPQVYLFVLRGYSGERQRFSHDSEKFFWPDGREGVGRFVRLLLLILCGQPFNRDKIGPWTKGRAV